ncbi:MAG: potassium channel protein [Acidobacteriota bacterium]
MLEKRLAWTCFALLVVLITSTFGYMVLLDATFADSFYMVVITLSTVGYGEVVPGIEQNDGARLFTVLLIFTGMGLLLYVVSAFTAFLVEGELTDILRKRRMQRQVDAMSGHVIICGSGAMCAFALSELTDSGCDVVIVDDDEERLALLHGHEVDLPFFKEDPTNDEVLLRAGIERASGLLANLTNDKDNLFLTFTARQLNPDIRIIARGLEKHLEERLSRAGADSVVMPSKIGALRMVSELLRPKVVDFLDRMLRPAGADWRFGEVPVGEAANGRTLGSLGIPGRFGMPVLAVIDEAGEVTYHPKEDTTLSTEDKLVVLAEMAQVREIQEWVAKG